MINELANDGGKYSKLTVFILTVNAACLLVDYINRNCVTSVF